MTTFCITGMGVISAIGNNVAENYQSLLQKKSGVAKVKYLQTNRQDSLLGEVKATDNELKFLAGIHSSEEIDRTTLLGIIATKEAIEQAGLSTLSQVALISSTSVGGMCYTELEYPKYLHGEAYPNFINTHECAASTFKIARHFGIKGYTDTLSTACSSGANALMQACKLIKNGLCDVAIAGGTDALSLFTLNGFNTLMIADKDWCRPFDISRAGLNLGEGAAYLVVESLESATKRGASILATISGFANCNDAYHQTASSPEGIGASMAIEGALNMAGIQPSQINYINAHGTATPNNDLSESVAIQNIFGSEWPMFSSVKAYTGHTLAAAGAIEAVYSVLSISKRVVFPNLNFSNPLEEFNKIPVTEVLENQDIDHVLSNSFGFGGNCSSLVFSRH